MGGLNKKLFNVIYKRELDDLSFAMILLDSLRCFK